jgi:hypothetical protein
MQQSVLVKTHLKKILDGRDFAKTTKPPCNAQSIQLAASLNKYTGSMLVRRVTGSVFVTMRFRFGRGRLLLRGVGGGVLVFALTMRVGFTASAKQQTSSKHCEEKDFFHVSMIEK